ncbi:MerR family transcriptional regulator [Paenibacillus sp. MMS20-IR301]|uniref:MerR family transcriptional regulator n=1 Tax=Paenibacillus sp. MMS20-IR301 TaxID=2895946 RepID=UPI0028E21D1B|nr:MerR family transcriptional regulator [Paenibacillus sp. MMS20-IR301]WNS42303.1 MerR family transcriptional regulator [Paenibacillus sp. MMS20-IR301]
MYTIGELANIMRISKDKLRYYEEKEILTPIQNEENNYRQYDFKDIDTVLAIEFYRSLDLEFKTIQKLCKESDIKDMQGILDDKHNEIIRNIARLNTIALRIEKAKKDCDDIEKHLNNYSIRPMAPIKSLGEISDFRAYKEFEVIHNNRDQLVEEPIFKSLKRYITFNEEGIQSNTMLVTKDVEVDNTVDEKDILDYKKCIYTVVEDGMQYEGVMEDSFIKGQRWMAANNYKHIGVAIIGMLLVGYHEGILKSYLEVYIPIE